jgi:hypothetical protein
VIRLAILALLFAMVAVSLARGASPGLPIPPCVTGIAINDTGCAISGNGQ